MKSMMEIMARVNAEMRGSNFIRAVTGGFKEIPEPVKPDEGIIIRRVVSHKWTGLKEASRLLNRSATQILRHVSGEQPSAKLARDMDRLGIRVEVAGL